MGIGYQMVDRKVVDYDIWFPGPEGLGLRGPRTDPEAKGLICCIGAAQTFGRFVKRPYPLQLGSIMDKPVLNLGFSGAGPGYFLANEFLIHTIGRAETVIIQCMSARSVTAGHFRTAGNNGVLEFLDGPRKGEQMLAQEALSILRSEYGEDVFQGQVRAAQAEWVSLCNTLTSRIGGRKILLWMSSCAPGENVDLSKSPVGTFPHFVTRDMVDAVAKSCDGYVECTVENMRSQVLFNDLTLEVEAVFDKERFPKRPDHTRHLNTYYATPEVHDKAASLICRHLLSGTKA